MTSVSKKIAAAKITSHQPAWPSAEADDLPGEIFIGKSARLQVTHQRGFFRAVDEPAQHADSKNAGATISPFAVEGAGLCPPIYQLPN